MNIQQRIRRTAKSKVKVSITKRTRSKGGFYVWYPDLFGGSIKQGGSIAKTKCEAEQILLAKVRCFQEFHFEITVRPPHREDQ